MIRGTGHRDDICRRVGTSTLTPMLGLYGRLERVRKQPEALSAGTRTLEAAFATGLSPFSVVYGTMKELARKMEGRVSEIHGSLVDPGPVLPVLGVYQLQVLGAGDSVSWPRTAISAR